MIILFFIVIVFNVISAEDRSDTKFIEDLPEGDKKVFLNKVARRILEEVPEVDSGASAQVDGDVLDERLEEQSDFVKKILKEEVDNLKAQRRHSSDLKKNESNENVNRTSSEVTDKVIERSNSTVTDEKKSGHIDLTLRTDRLKRNDDTNVNHFDGTKNDNPAHEVKDSSVIKSKESKRQDTKEHISKDDVKESSEKNTREREKDGMNSQSDKSKKSQEISASDNINANVTESKGSENVHNTLQKTIKLLDNVTSNKGLEDIGFITTTEAVVTTLKDLTINDAESKKKENSTLLIKSDAVLKENEENYTTTKPASAIKYKLRMQVDNKTELINQSGKEKSAEAININSSNSTEYLENKSSIENKTEHNNMIGNVTLNEDTPQKPEIHSTLTTTEDSYKSTGGSSPSPSIQKVSKISGDSNTVINHNKLDKAEEKNITSTLDINNLDTVPTVISSTTSRTIERENNANLYNNITIINVNQTRIMTANGNHSNQSMKENIKKSDTVKVQSTNNKAEATIDDKTGSTLRRGSKDAQNSESDELLHVLTHFGDLEVEKVYHVYEVDPNKPVFIQHHKQKIKIEQPQYAPVYNYDPKHAYFSAYNRLGPNVGELDNDNVSENNLRVFESKGSPNYIDMDYYFDRHERTEKQTKRIFKIPANQHPQSSHHDDDDNRSDIKQKLPKIKEKPKNNAYGHWKEIPQTSSDSDEDKHSEIKQQPPKIKKKPKNNVNKEQPQIASDDDNRSEVKQKPPKIKKKPDNDDHLIIPDSGDEDHPFDLHKKGLKDNLQGVRNVFYQNKVFGYVPNRPERIEKWIHNVKDLYNNALGKSTEEVLINAGTDIYKPHLRSKDDTDGDVFNDAMEDMRDDEEKSISTTKQLKVIFIKPENDKDLYKILRTFKGDEGDPNYYWNQEEQTLTHNKTVYDLKKLVPATIDENHRTIAQWEEARAPLYRMFGNFSAISQRSLERFRDVPDETYKKAKMHLFDINRKKHFINNTDLLNMVMTIDKIQAYHKKNVSKQRSNNLHERTNKGIILKTAEEFNKTAQKINVSNHYDVMQNAPKNVDSMAKISYMTPAVDIVTNAIKMWDHTYIKPALRNNDELRVFLNILKDFVTMDNSALEKFDWLGTSVDIQAALAKLKELKANVKRGHYIHPSDLEILKYTEGLYEKAKQLESGDDQETSRAGRKVLSKSRGAFPKRNKKIKKPLKAWDKVRALMMRLKKKNETDGFEEFLNDLQDSLKDFHTAIKEISMITKYDNQKWYKNIKALYLDSAGDKEYLELLLHLIANRLFGLIEESAINGAERDFKKYIKENRAEVDRTEVEFILILKVLKEIKQQKG